MRKAALFTMIFALALFAMPAMATHPNFIDFVLVTDVNAQSNPNLLYPDIQWQPETITNSRGMYPASWGGEDIGQKGSQGMYHYVSDTWHGAGNQGSWRHKAQPSAGAPVILDFDLRNVYDMQSMVVWNWGSPTQVSADQWYVKGVKDVAVHYKRAPWDEWTKYGDFVIGPCGFLRGTRDPRNLWIGPGTNPWGTYRSTNAIKIGGSYNVTSQVQIPAPGNITSGPIFDHYYYDAGQNLTAGNVTPIDISGIDSARFIRFEIKSNWGDPAEVGLMEVRFYKDGPGMFIDVDPAPAYSWSYVHPGNNLAFGDAYRMWTRSKDVLVYNLGTTPATVTGASIEGPFSVDDSAFGTTIAPPTGLVYRFATVTALFGPTDIGPQSGRIHLEYETQAGSFIETLNVTGNGKDVAFGFIPYAAADATQWTNPWWGGYIPQCVVDGRVPANDGGASFMTEDLGEFVYGSKNAKMRANVGNSWRTGGYPQYAGLPEVEDVQFAVDLAGAKAAEINLPNAPNKGDAPKKDAAVTHKVAEVRVWNFNQVTNNACEAAIRSVKIETSTDDVANFRDVTNWTSWDDLYEFAQPAPNVETGPTDVLDFSAHPAFRWWRFTTLGLAAGAPGANYGHASMVGMGCIRFYTTKVNLLVTPSSHDFGNVAPYSSNNAPAVAIENVGTGSVSIDSIAWVGNSGPFEITGMPTVPATLASGQSLTGLQVNFTPRVYGTFQGNLGIQVTDLSSTDEVKPVVNVTLVFRGSCLSVENGFIPVSHAWASSSWDGNWTPNWTHAPNGLAVQEVPAGVWGSRGMQHSGNVAGGTFMWHARQSGYPEPSANWIAWDFGSTKTVYDMLVWNSMRSCCDGSMRGFRRVKVQYTNDAPPTVNGGSEWGPWGGAAIPIDYMVAWDGLNWLELPVATLAHYPVVSMNPINWNTPNGYFPASNQLNGQPIQFQGRTARMVRLAADSATWADYYMNNQQEGWYNTPQSYQYCLAEARFYGPASDAIYDVTAHDFGSVKVGESASVDITVANLNSATADLIVNNLVVEDRARTGVTSPYTLARKGGGSLPVTIAKGQSEVFTVTFAPTEAGDFNTFDSVILNNSSRNGIMLTTLHGTAYEEGSPDVFLPATSVDFGQRFLQLGTQRAPFTIKNMGDTNLTVDFAFDPSSTFGTTQAGTLTVPGFGEAVVWLTVTPQAIGSANGVMTLTTNDGDEGTIEVPLSVTVANAAAASVDSSWMLYE